jgi:hypothetical protein
MRSARRSSRTNCQVAGSGAPLTAVPEREALFFGLEPVIGFGAELIAALYIEFVSAAAGAFFEFFWYASSKYYRSPWFREQSTSLSY